METEGGEFSESRALPLQESGRAGKSVPLPLPEHLSAEGLSQVGEGLERRQRTREPQPRPRRGRKSLPVVAEMIFKKMHSVHGQRGVVVLTLDQISIELKLRGFFKLKILNMLLLYYSYDDCQNLYNSEFI